jgi:hypothetical protein
MNAPLPKDPCPDDPWPDPVLEPGASPRLEIPERSFGADFGWRPFALRHRLVGHPLFELPRILQLARVLPEDRIEYNAGEVPLTLDPKLTPRTGLSAEETLRRIAECKSWMVLKNIERDPEYQALMNECLDQVHAMEPSLSPGMREREGFIFVSSPGSLTPFHMDHEQNFLLQIAGSKTMHVLPRSDCPTAAPGAGSISAQEIERFYTGAHRNLVFREDYRKNARAFLMTPGVGVHVPPIAPHWVQNGPEVSISFSITFQTDETLRSAHAHRFNARLRSMGWNPRPVGRSRMEDRAKHFMHRVCTRLEKISQRA